MTIIISLLFMVFVVVMELQRHWSSSGAWMNTTALVGGTTDGPLRSPSFLLFI